MYKKPGATVLHVTVVEGLGIRVRLDGPNDVHEWYAPCGFRACSEVVARVSKGFHGFSRDVLLLLRSLRRRRRSGRRDTQNEHVHMKYW